MKGPLVKIFVYAITLELLVEKTVENLYEVIVVFIFVRLVDTKLDYRLLPSKL